MFDVVDDGDGQAVLAEYGLKPGRFLCVVPRLRFTPYHQIRNYPPEGRGLFAGRPTTRAI